MKEQDELMLRQSRVLLELSHMGVIVLDIANNVKHLEAAGFMAGEVKKYLRGRCCIPEVRCNLVCSLRNIALNAVLPEDGMKAKSYRVRSIRYPGYCVNEVNKGIYVFVLLCEIDAVKFDKFSVKHRQMLQSLKTEILPYKGVFPWEDAFTAGMRIMDMAIAAGHLQRVMTGYSGFLEAIGNLR